MFSLHKYSKMYRAKSQLCLKPSLWHWNNRRNLKPHIHDKPFYGMGTSGLFRSENCLRATSPCLVREQGTNLYVGKYGFSLVHPNVQPPLHSQSPCANLNGNADACYVCGDWLVCRTISVCKCNPVACILRLVILARA